MKIFIGGSVSDKIDEKYIKEGNKLVDLIIENRFDVICCADLRGIIGNLYKRVKKSKSQNIKLAIPKIYLQYSKDIKGKIDVITNTINQRTDECIRQADACLFMPGGIGTIYEIMSTIETKRAGEHDNKVIIINLYGYYNELIKMLEKVYSEKFASIVDSNVYKIVNSVQEAIEYLKNKF